MPETMKPMTLVLPERLWLVLRKLAEQRALAAGGRPSGAAVLRDLLEAEGERRGVDPRA